MSGTVDFPDFSRTLPVFSDYSLTLKNPDFSRSFRIVLTLSVTVSNWLILWLAPNCTWLASWLGWQAAWLGLAVWLVSDCLSGWQVAIWLCRHTGLMSDCLAGWAVGFTNIYSDSTAVWSTNFLPRVFEPYTSLICRPCEMSTQLFGNAWSTCLCEKKAICSTDDITIHEIVRTLASDCHLHCIQLTGKSCCLSFFLVRQKNCTLTLLYKMLS